MTQRPLAVGLFGHAYGGKGYDQLAALRASLADDIEIVVAGRGTEALPPVSGIRILGPVDGESEQAFFGSVRCLLLPYGEAGRYGEMYSVSGAAARAFAYSTAVIAARVKAFAELSTEGGFDAVSPGIDALASRVDELVRSGSELSRKAAEIETLKQGRSLNLVAGAYLRNWESLLSPHRP